MNAQMIRVISSPSSSTIGFWTLIFAICGRRDPSGAGGEATAGGAAVRYNRGDGHRRAPPLSRATHEVFNQAVPLAGLQHVRGATGCWARRCGARAASGPRSGPARSARSAGSRAAIGWGRGEREPAAAAHPRPLRQPHRRGRVPPRLARAACGAGSASASTRCPGASRSRARTSRARRCSSPLAGRGRRRLPDLDDLLGDPGAAHAARAGGRVGAALPLPALRRRAARPAPDKDGALCGMAMTEKQGGSDVRANTTTATPAERRRARGPSTSSPATSGSARRRCATRSSSSRRPTAGLSCFLLPRFTPDGERNAHPHPAAQGQARQPLERVERGRVPRRLGADGRRGGSRRADDHRDGQPHPARLRARRRRGHADRGRARRSTTPASARPSASSLVDQPLMRNVLADLAIESEAGDDLARCGWRAPSTSRTPAAPSGARGTLPAARRRPCSSTGSASGRRRTPARRSSASAATATSRSPGCRAFTARRR